MPRASSGNGPFARLSARNHVTSEQRDDRDDRAADGVGSSDRRWSCALLRTRLPTIQPARLPAAAADQHDAHDQSPRRSSGSLAERREPWSEQGAEHHAERPVRSAPITWSAAPRR